MQRYKTELRNISKYHVSDSYLERGRERERESLFSKYAKQNIILN